MKKIITGASLLIAGAILAFATFFASGSAMSLLYSWSHHGRFWSAMFDVNLMGVFVVAVLLMLAGVAAMIWGNCEHGEKK